jgi:hypothetical protein
MKNKTETEKSIEIKQQSNGLMPHSSNLLTILLTYDTRTQDSARLGTEEYAVAVPCNYEI